MEYIIIYIILYVITNIVSKKVDSIMCDEFILKVYNKGYKIISDEIEKMTVDDDNVFFNEFIGKIFSFIPFVNIVVTYIIDKKNISIILESDQLERCLIKFTEQELKEYNSLTKRSNKLEFAYSHSESYQEILNKLIKHNIDEIPKVVVLQERLLPLSYTYEEVMKINKVAGNNVLFGMINNVCVAIVGMPGNIKNIERVVIPKNDEEAEYDLLVIPENEVLDKHFLIYPFVYDKDKEINQVIDEIIDNRNEKRKNWNSYNHNVSNYETTPLSDNYVKKKTLYNSKY